jgi:hypothetical protein
MDANMPGYQIYTPQNIFDAAAVHLFTQGKQALAENSKACVYRAPDGCKCGFGYFIPDDKYSPGMEGKSAFGVIDRYGLSEFKDHSPLMSQIQNVHDSSNNWNSTQAMREALIAIKDYLPLLQLNTSIVDTLSFTDR